MGITGLRLGDLFFERADGLAVVASCNRSCRSLERAGLLDALGSHVLQKLGPDFCSLHQIKNGLGLGLVEGSSGSVVIIADNHDVEDIAGDIAAKKRIGAPDCLHTRLTTVGVERGRHKGVFIMAAWQMLQTATDQDPAALPRFVGIGEIISSSAKSGRRCLSISSSGAYLKASKVPFWGF